MSFCKKAVGPGVDVLRFSATKDDIKSRCGQRFQSPYLSCTSKLQFVALLYLAIYDIIAIASGNHSLATATMFNGTRFGLSMI